MDHSYSYPSVSIVLLSLPVTYSSLLSGLPGTLTNQWEGVASTIIHRYVHLIYDVQIICESTCVSDQFLKRLPIPKQNSRQLHEDSLVLVMARTEPFVMSALDNSANSTKSKFVIFVECDECVTVSWLLEQCWQHKFLNVVAIPVTNKVFPVYSYFPFREGRCFDSSPVLIDTFTDSFEFNVELFPKRKVWNLRNCTLVVASFNLFPVIYFDHMEMKGLYSSVFYAIAKSMNFRPQVTLTVEQFGAVSGPKKTGLRGEVFTGRADLGFMLLSSLNFEYVDYDSLAMTGCLTWCCPATFKTKPVLWLIFGEFSPAVWVMLLLSAAGTVGTDIVIQKCSRQNASKRNGDTYVKVWGALLQASGTMPSYQAVPFRAFWISWLIVSVVISTLYLSTMKSFQAAPNNEYTVNSLEDLADVGPQAWYHEGFAKMIEGISQMNAAVAKLKSKSVILTTEMGGSLFNRLRYKNMSAFMLDNLCKVYADVYANDFYLYVVPNACMLTTSAHLFVMQRNSVYTEAITILVDRLTQAGIVQRTWSGNNTSPRSFVMKQESLSLEAMLPTFLVLACGLLVSFITLICEMLSIKFS